MSTVTNHRIMSTLPAVASALTALVLLGACASTADAPTATGIPTRPTTSENPTTSAPGDAPPVTTSPTTPATEPASSTATSAPATTTPADTTPPVEGPATVVTMDGLDLVERDTATGEVVTTLVSGLTGEATYPGDFTLFEQRTRMVFDEFVEDSWFSCETSPGAVLEIDLATGERTTVGSGFSPAVGPDDRLLAHLEASQCLPDPEQPADFVITPYDTVVVIDGSGGTRVTHRLPVAPADWDAPEALAWVGFDGDGSLFVSTNGGTLHQIPADDVLGPGVDPSAVVVGDVDLNGTRPVEVAGSSLVTEVLGAEGSHDVFLVDLTTGESTLAVASEYPVQVGVSADDVVLVGYDPRDGTPAIAPGAAAVIVPVGPGDGFSRVLGGIDG